MKRRQQKAICCRLITGVNTNLEASNFTELSADCVQKIHSMLEAGETLSTARQRFLRELKSACKDEVAYFPPLHRPVVTIPQPYASRMALTVMGGNDRLRNGKLPRRPMWYGILFMSVISWRVVRRKGK